MDVSPMMWLALAAAIVLFLCLDLFGVALKAGEISLRQAAIASMLPAAGALLQEGIDVAVILTAKASDRRSCQGRR